MKNFQEVNGFHIEPTNMCTLKCPGCSRTRFLDAWPQHWKNYSLNLQELFNFLDIDISGKFIHLCGNYGDPIYHPELIELVRELKKRGTKILISTNGSYRKKDWWEELVGLLTEEDKIIFGIDGIPENFTQYRINANWESIEIGLRAASQGKCKTTWQYIVFNYNQDNIAKAQDIANTLGIDYFNLCRSDRFDSKIDYLVPDEKFLATRKDRAHAWKQPQDTHVEGYGGRAHCYGGRGHYISAAGYYAPCCYVGDHRFLYKTIFGKNKNQYDIKNTTLTKIFNIPDVSTFYNSLEDQSVCQFNCPNIIHKE